LFLLFHPHSILILFALFAMCVIRAAEPVWCNIAAVLPPPNPRDHICLYSRRSRSLFPRFRRVHCHSRSKTCRRTSGSSTRHMRRRCCCTFTWHPGTSHAVSPFL
jgi:hypothetical protein